MPKFDTVQQAFSVGIVDKDKLHRTDLLRVQLGAEEQTNFLGTVTGSMFLRPGLEYLGTQPGKSRLISFSRGESSRAILAFSDQVMRVQVADAYVTRPAVTSTVTSGDFSAATGWTLSGGAAIDTSREVLSMKADAKGAKAIATQEVATSSANVEHALRIEVTSGPVKFRCGSTDGDDDYIAESTLLPGVHSLAFTPTGSFWVRFHVEYTTHGADPYYVDSIEVESAGVLSIPTPWIEDDLGSLRFAQSLDVFFVAAAGYRQNRIEHRGDTSWSLTDYQTLDGPYGAVRLADADLSLSAAVWPSSLGPGAYNMTASVPLFTADHVGSVFKFFTQGESVIATVGAASQYSETIRVTGVKSTNYNDRDWTYSTFGTWAGTLTVERSFDGPEDGFRDFRNDSASATIGFSANVAAVSNDDDDDNAVVWYRIGFKPSDYTSGEADIWLTYDGQEGDLLARVLAVPSSTIANIEFINKTSGSVGTIPPSDWVEMEWRTGVPSAVAVFDGRLGWGGQDRLWLSVSDAFDSFDAEFEGDAGPIVRALAAGGSNVAQWMLPLNELLIGTDTNVLTARASELGELIAPASTSIKVVNGSVGCAAISPIQIGDGGLFVGRSNKDLRLITWAGSGYMVREISKLTTDIFESGVVEMAFQATPDPRIWIVTEDGKLICVVYDPENEVLGFFLCETDGLVESVTVSTNAVQDRLYVSVQRTINGGTVRYLEKMALDSETKPDTLCKVMDAFAVETAVGTLVSNLDHLEGETVVAWASGGPILDSDEEARSFTVASGSISLPPGYENAEVVVGLPYRGRYKSGRLGFGVDGYNPMLKNKRLVSLGMIMTDFARKGILFGSDFTDMDPLRVLKDGIPAPAIVLDEVADEDPHAVESGFTLDSRACIEVNSPFPARFLAMTLHVESN